MDHRCPNCRQHEFSIWYLLNSTRGRSFFFCPRCDVMLSFGKKQGRWINLISLAGFIGFVAAGLPFVATDRTGGIFFLLSVTSFGFYLAVRAVAIEKLGKIVKFDAKRKDQRSKLKLSEVSQELEWLRSAQTFVVLFDPQDRGYLSLYYRAGVFIIDLSFATRALEELRPKFTQALEKVGSRPREFKVKTMRGVEVELGDDLGEASRKVEKIMCEMFDLKPDAEILVMRDKK